MTTEEREAMIEELISNTLELLYGKPKKKEDNINYPLENEATKDILNSQAAS